MKQRVITGVIFAAIFLPSIIAGGIYFYCLGLLITFVSTFELMNMFEKKNDGLKVLKYVVPFFSAIFFTLLVLCLKGCEELKIFISNENKLEYVYGPLVSYRPTFDGINGFIGVTIGSVLLFTLVIALLSVVSKNPGRTASNSILAFIYGGVIMSCALGVEYMEGIINDGFFPYWLGKSFAYIYSVVALTDVFAYLIGSKLGKHKMCPNLSPKKSWEGAIGGTLVGSLVGCAAAYVFGVMPIASTMGVGQIILVVALTYVFTVMVSIVSQFGDLFASSFKREYEIKDYGNILPGHGGILDRFDSTALAGAFYFVIFMIVKMIVMLA